MKRQASTYTPPPQNAFSTAADQDACFLTGKVRSAAVNENLLPGSYEVTFDAKGIASGVYLYRLRAGEFAQIKCMLLMR